MLITQEYFKQLGFILKTFILAYKDSGKNCLLRDFVSFYI